MIAIVILAPVFAASAWLYQLSTQLEDFYGPRGDLALRQQIDNEISAGTDDLRRSRFAEAETRYGAALRLFYELRATRARHGWRHVDYQTSDILVGLADALVGQHRHPEAVQVLQDGAVRERQMGHLESAKDLTARADAIRAEMVQLAR
jgi:hypothetical protein